MGTLLYINRIKDYFDKTSREFIVQSLAHSILNYCNKVLGTTNNTLLIRKKKKKKKNRQCNSHLK